MSLDDSPRRPEGTEPHPPWARPLLDWAVEFGVSTAQILDAAAVCNLWWITNERKQINQADAARIRDLLGELGVLRPFPPATSEADGSVPCCSPALHPSVDLHVVERTGPPEDTADTSVSDHVDTPATSALPARRISDIERVRNVVRQGSEVLRGRHGRWALGEVLRLMWESKASQRIAKERGILLIDILTGVELELGPSGRLPTGTDLTSTVIGELRRLHRGRLAFFFVDTEALDGPTLRARQIPRGDEPLSRSSRRHLREAADLPLEVGQIAWVAIEETVRGLRSTKRHPSVLLARTGRRNDRWLILAMTSSVDVDPDLRAVPNAAALGLAYSGYLWHETAKVYKHQIERPVGWVNRELVDVIDRVIGLRGSQRAELESIADLHHPR